MSRAKNHRPSPGLFGPEYDRVSRQLPVIGEQKDIRYYSSPAKSVLNGPETTGMGFWSINPYIGCAFGCAYCYARYTHRYVMERAATDDKMTNELGEAYNKLPPWLAFERNIFVKGNAPEVLSRTLRFGSDRHLKLLEGETIVIGTATDPYQPAERKFRVTRGILQVLAEHPGLSVMIITKSPLITRDIDLLSRINRHSELSVHISLITLDRDLARRIEPRSPTPESRIRALARLREAGIDAGDQLHAGAARHHRQSFGPRGTGEAGVRSWRDLRWRLRSASQVGRSQTIPAIYRAGVSASGGEVP